MNEMKHNSKPPTFLKRFVRRTKQNGLAKVEAMVQVFRGNKSNLSHQRSTRRLSIVSVHDHLFGESKLEKIGSNQSLTPTTLSASETHSPETESMDLVMMKTEMKDLKLESKSKPIQEINEREETIKGLKNRLRSHQIQWSAMIELEKMDPTGTLRGMSARQIRGLIKQKRSEAWLTWTDGPLYESEEEEEEEAIGSDRRGLDGSDEVKRRSSNLTTTSSISHYYLALEPSDSESSIKPEDDDQDWYNYL